MKKGVLNKAIILSLIFFMFFSLLPINDLPFLLYIELNSIILFFPL